MIRAARWQSDTESTHYAVSPHTENRAATTANVNATIVERPRASVHAITWWVRKLLDELNTASSIGRTKVFLIALALTLNGAAPTTTGSTMSTAGPSTARATAGPSTGTSVSTARSPTTAAAGTSGEATTGTSGKAATGAATGKARRAKLSFDERNVVN